MKYSWSFYPTSWRRKTPWLASMSSLQISQVKMTMMMLLRAYVSHGISNQTSFRCILTTGRWWDNSKLIRILQYCCHNIKDTCTRNSSRILIASRRRRPFARTPSRLSISQSTLGRCIYQASWAKCSKAWTSSTSPWPNLIYRSLCWTSIANTRTTSKTKLA